MYKKQRKIAITFILIVLGVLCFCVPYSKSFSYKYPPNSTIEETVTRKGVEEMFNYIGLFFLAFTVYQWRKELGISSFGPFGAPLDPAPPGPYGGPNQPPKNIPPPPDHLQARFVERKEKVFELFQLSPTNIFSNRIIANKLSLSPNIVDEILYSLVLEGKIRKDTYQGTLQTNFTLQNSPVNVLIDNFIQELTDRKEVVISDTRYLRTKNLSDIDGLVKTNYTTYLVEVKITSNVKNFRTIISQGLNQLLNLVKSVNINPLNFVIIIGVKSPVNELEGTIKEIQKDFSIMNLQIKCYQI